MTKKLVTVLSIAGSDPTGGAGIQNDIRVGIKFGVHVLTAVTAVTSQNSKGLKDYGVVTAQTLKNQLDCIWEETIPNAVKIGLIGNEENLNIIADFLKDISPNIPIVIDPVLSITSQQNSQFNDSATIINGYLKELFPLASVVTPNLIELERLTGSSKINSQTLKNLNTKAAVVKGGHSTGERIEDILLMPEERIEMRHERINCKNLHGTGCCFSSFLASYLALGYTLKDAFTNTCSQVNQIISESCAYSLGDSNYGALNINGYKL